jgi:hypothetical protein
MDDGKRLWLAASTQPASTPSLEWAVDNFVQKFWWGCIFLIDMYFKKYPLMIKKSTESRTCQLAKPEFCSCCMVVNLGVVCGRLTMGVRRTGRWGLPAVGQSRA